MNSSIPLAWSAVAVSLCGLAMGMLLLPQRLLQRPMAEGVITVQLEPGGQLRVWHQPISLQGLRSLLVVAARRQPTPRLRLIPDPQLPWSEVRRILLQINHELFPLELQLPPARGL